MNQLLAPPRIPDTRRRELARRREFLAGMAAAGLLVACGGGGNATGGPSTISGTGRRTLEHPGGTTEIPVRAERVVSLSEVLAGHLTSVGLVPVGADEGIGEWLDPYRGLLEPTLDLEAINAVTVSGEPNLEAVASLAPDLILAETFFEEFFAELSRVAPTVLIDRPTNADWKAAFDATVDAAGREAEADAVRKRYAAVRDRVSAAGAEVEVSFVRHNGDGTFRIDGTDGFAGSVAADAGLAVTDPPAGIDAGAVLSDTLVEHVRPG